MTNSRQIQDGGGIDDDVVVDNTVIAIDGSMAAIVPASQNGVIAGEPSSTPQDRTAVHSRAVSIKEGEDVDKDHQQPPMPSNLDLIKFHKQLGNEEEERVLHHSRSGGTLINDQIEEGEKTYSKHTKEGSIKSSIEDETQGPEYLTSIKFIPIFFGLCLVVFMISLDNTVVATAQVPIVNQIGGQAEIAWLPTTFLIGQASFSILFGQILAHFSSKYVFMIALFLFELGSLVSGIGPNMGAVLAGRTVSGVGAAGVVPTLNNGNQVAAVRPKSVRQTLPAIAVAAFAAFGGLLFGYDTGTISGVIGSNTFKQDFGYPDPAKGGAYELGTSRTSLFVSILSAGTFFGALLGAPIADFLGRRWGLQVAMAIFCLGVALQTAAGMHDDGLFVAGRVIAGLGVGVISTIVPMYQSETAPRWIRGAVVSGYQWAITIGLLIAAIVNNSTNSRSDTGAYRIPIALQIGFAIIMSIGIIFLPESPRWFIRGGKHDRAAKSLAFLNSTDIDDPVVRAEIADIQTNLDLELTHGTVLTWTASALTHVNSLHVQWSVLPFKHSNN
ncbi:hypothetical protein L7F22_039317 [Adiantum nelumboides]|nr:hypothetical protein [Adiantum nelumboides]